MFSVITSYFPTISKVISNCMVLPNFHDLQKYHYTLTSCSGFWQLNISRGKCHILPINFWCQCFPRLGGAHISTTNDLRDLFIIIDRELDRRLQCSLVLKNRWKLLSVLAQCPVEMRLLESSWKTFITYCQPIWINRSTRSGLLGFWDQTARKYPQTLILLEKFTVAPISQFTL